MPLQKCISSSGMKCAFSIYKFLTRASLLVCEFYLAIDHWEQLSSCFEKSKCCRSSPFGNRWLAYFETYQGHYCELSCEAPRSSFEQREWKWRYFEFERFLFSLTQPVKTTLQPIPVPTKTSWAPRAFWTFFFSNLFNVISNAFPSLVVVYMTQ